MMKIRFILCAMLATLSFGQRLSAYLFSFSNHTNDPLWVRIHLTADKSDKFYEVLLEARKAGDKAMHTFKFGSDQGYKLVEAEWYKGGFCFGDVYVRTPITETKTVTGPTGEELDIDELVKDKDGKVMFGPWREAAITLVKTEGANAIVEAAAALGDTAQSFAKDIAGSVLNYQDKKAAEKEKAK
jgi:hypothetical protein